ncbi:hypothetical protein QBC46DRAFT_388871 [Diplogelasinospora grovesii]|uniref:Fatty acid hydroxylase domain-containing protein n=1 Tax=Diplogelasinospora grovesii TaxID=303347 RepID=A0AAN6S3E4_9PEZI|nr:hypothetical protein QBC46DRAFT_388871 [Diplogelasinospora grovesii]
MDLLLSLPIASYFFSTSLTSWSTSLNLLFFYMTWSTLVLSHSPLKVELYGVTALRLVFWLVPSLLFLLFDTLVPSLSETIKFNSSLPRLDSRTITKLVTLALFNFGLETALEFGSSLFLSTMLQEPVFRTSTTLPLPWQMIKHIALLFTAREFLTYYIHRYLLHPPTTQARKQTGGISTLHKNYAHNLRGPPFSLQLMCDHPLPFLLHRFLPLYIPALALRKDLHVLTYFAFVGLATIEETLSMSGYTVIPGIIMGGITRRNALHYCRPVGNFGCWGFLDWVHGTSLGNDVVKDIKDEARKHRLKERSAKKADDAGGMLQNGVEGLRRSARSRTGRKSNANNGY